MSDEDTIKSLIATSREKLQHATERLQDTPKPQSACAAHDAMFAVQRATADALDTILVVLAGRVNAAVAATYTLQGVLASNAKTLIWAGAIVISIAMVSGNFDKLMDGILRLKGNNMSSMMQYEPGG